MWSGFRYTGSTRPFAIGSYDHRVFLYLYACMQRAFNQQQIGILGGGQLGKMLCQAGSRWGLSMHLLDADPSFPAGQVNPRFQTGDFRREEDVYRFGRKMDVVTIEIEHVSIEALERLKKEGIAVYPDPEVLRIIKDKGHQKAFYQEHGLPTAPFVLMDGPDEIRAALLEGRLSLPFVQKSRLAGYDGRGVAVIRTPADLEQLLPGPCVVEDLIHMEREVSVIIVRDTQGRMRTFPAVEMAFHPTANLVEMLFCPAHLTPAQEKEAEELALRVGAAFHTTGLLAVEMFLTDDGRFLVNEVAPRPHNSGHHTIECCETSQYEQHLRAITGLPLGDTRLLRPAVMINLLGEPGFSGKAIYEGWDSCLELPGVHVHLYGKEETRPFRKMGHVTISGDTLEEAMDKARFVQSHLKVIA